jgi:L-fuconolactonase
MIIVDSHVHASQLWYEPVETLLSQMERNRVSKALLIQYGGSSFGYEIECVRKYPGRFGAVILIDSQRPDAPEIIEANASNGAIGVRTSAYNHFPGKDPLAVWRKAAEWGLHVSCYGTVELFTAQEFLRIIEEFPNLKIVLEHLGGASKTKQNPNPNHQLYDKVLELSKYPNVYIKVPGFGEILSRPYPMVDPIFDHPPPQIKMVYETFGPRHMMWGSDFPPCAAREGYSNALRYPLERVPFFTQEDKEWIFGKTALSVWNIPDHNN